MATGTAQPKATKDTFLLPPEELVLDRDWNGRWKAVSDEPATTEKTDVFGGKDDDKTVQKSIREIAASIKELGQLEDILICKRPADPQGRIYHVVAGQSRTRAVALLAKEDPSGDYKVRCRLITVKDDREAFLLNEEENRTRNNLTLLDKAFCMKREKDLGMTADEIGTRWGCSVQAVGQALSLVESPVEIQQGVFDKVISASNVIKDMRGLSDEEKIEIVHQATEAKAKGRPFGKGDVLKLARQYAESRKDQGPGQTPDTQDPTTGQDSATGQAAPGTNGHETATKPTKKRIGRQSNKEKGPVRSVTDLKKLLEGRDGSLSSAIVRYLDGYFDMGD